MLIRLNDDGTLMYLQHSAVQTFLHTSKDLPPASFYNASGRGYPDVSAASLGFWIILDLEPRMTGITQWRVSTVQSLTWLARAVRPRPSRE